MFDRFCKSFRFQHISCFKRFHFLGFFLLSRNLLVHNFSMVWSVVMFKFLSGGDSNRGISDPRTQINNWPTFLLIFMPKTRRKGENGIIVASICLDMFHDHHNHEHTHYLIFGSSKYKQTCIFLGKQTCIISLKQHTLAKYPCVATWWNNI